jgi:hypothetical protein
MKIKLLILAIFSSVHFLYAKHPQWSEYYVTPEMFGCVSDNWQAAEQNSQGLQKAIDCAIEKGLTLVSARNKKYYIAKGLIITGHFDMDFGKATIIATDTMSMLTFKNGIARKYAGSIRNFRLDMNDEAKIGINCENAIKLRFTDGEIVGIKKGGVGFYMGKGYEVFVDNIHFRGGQNNATGIMMRTSDCHFSDCVMINCHTAIDNLGCNFYCRIHAWMTAPFIKESTFYRSRGGLAYLSQCFGDTFDCAFDIVGTSELHISQFRVFHNRIMWKEPYDKLSPVVFYFANNSIANKSYITLIDSNIGGLVLDGKNRQIFTNMNSNSIHQYGTVVHK